MDDDPFQEYSNLCIKCPLWQCSLHSAPRWIARSAAKRKKTLLASPVELTKSIRNFVASPVELTKSIHNFVHTVGSGKTMLPRLTISIRFVHPTRPPQLFSVCPPASACPRPPPVGCRSLLFVQVPTSACFCPPVHCQPLFSASCSHARTRKG